MVERTCNPNTSVAETGEPQVGSQPKIHSETLSQKQNQTKNIPSDLFSSNDFYKPVSGHNCPILIKFITNHACSDYKRKSLFAIKSITESS
jgi:hypothetical protein